MKNPHIVCAALRLRGVDFCHLIIGPRHYDPVMRAQIEAGGNKAGWRMAEQGFIDQFGNFLTREEAYIVAKKNGQIKYRCGGDDEKLFSENLY